MRLLSSLCFYFILNCVSAFNFFPKYAHIFTDNIPGSYFGYAVLLQAGVSNHPSRVIIGSPKSNSSNNLLSSIIEPGAVYNCPLSNGEKCKQFLLDINGNKEMKSETKQRFYSKRDNSWLGGAIDGLDVANGKLVACSPRWINQIHRDIYYLQNGLCYLLEDSTNLDKNARMVIPLLDQAHQGFARPNESVYYYALGEAGMSVHFAKNNSELLFGAPGVLQWKGMIGKYSHDDLGLLDIPNPHFISALQDFSYFGYALSSGRITSISEEIWYVGGAPRGKNLYGQVLIFDYGTKRNSLKIYYEMHGQQEGEYFGAVLSVGDINGDHLDDIIVGSPMYSTQNHYDVGLVYVFINHYTSKGNFDRILINPLAPQHGARFGSAISIIGDVNKDGFSDVAIGAPYYNDGQGAIFIYLGSKSGISEQYSQRILATDINPFLRGFGSSFSRGVDIDNNNYNDLAIGSYLSSHAVVIKTRPVVELHPVLKSQRSQISIDVKSFQISSCLKYTGAHLPQTLPVKIQIIADDFYKRVNIKNSRGTSWEIVKEIQYKYNQESCEDYDILVINTQSDFSQPIEFKMTYELVELPENGFCATCPVVDKRLPNYTTLSIPYEIGCGSDNICKPNLKLNATYKKELIIGEEDKLDIAINITNTEEPAFACKFNIEIPTITAFIKIPNICQNTKDNVLLCDLGNPLKTNETKSFTLPLDVTMLGNNDKLVIKMNVTSSGREVDPSDNVLIINIPLKTEVSISVIGISNPEQFNFIEQEKLKQANLTFYHLYTVQNLGPSPLDDLKLTFLIPQSFSSEEENVIQVYKPEIIAEGTSMICITKSPEGFYVDPSDIPNIIEADGPSAAERASRARRTPPRSDIPPPEDTYDSAEEMNLPLDNPTVYTRVQKIIASDREIPEGLPENRTLAFGCGVYSEIQCMEVQCTSGLLKKNGRVMINFKLLGNLTVFDEKRDDKDTIVVTSSVQPESQYFTVNKTYTHTLLQGNVRQESPLKWIILGLVLGLILLCLIVYGLYRAGFFKREDHEKLMNEKEETFGELTVQSD